MVYAHLQNSYHSAYIFYIMIGHVKFMANIDLRFTRLKVTRVTCKIC